MPANDHLLSHLCQEEDTLKEAQSLLRKAQKKTGPGSGYELGPHTTGLPAICALLASQKLNNSDVTEKAAQMASCLKASDFNKALGIVRAAVGSTPKDVDPRKIYDHLLSTYGVSVSTPTFQKWLREAGDTIQVEDKKLNPEDPSHGKVIKCAIFYWAYESATGKPLATQKDFVEEQSLQLRTFSRVLSRISTICLLLRSRIAREAAAHAKANPVKATPSTPRRTPRKQPLRELPSRDTPTKRNMDGAPVDLEKPKRRIDLLDESLPETPTKRSRTASPLKPRAAASPTKRPVPPKPLPLSQPEASSPPLADEPPAPATAPQAPAEPQIHSPVQTSPPRTQEPLPQPEVLVVAQPVQNATTSHKVEPPRQVAQPPRRRFRPVYLDTAQWYSVDRRITQAMKQIRVR